MSSEVPSLGWLGTGRMGAALAGRLIDAGERVTVWNRTSAKTAPLVARGGRAVERITDLGECDVMVQALVEVTSLAEKGGTDRSAFLEYLNGTVVSSEWVRKRTGDLVSRDWTPTFTTELLRKDFDLGLDAARSLEVPMPVAGLVHQLIQSAIGIGLRDEDFLSLYDQQARVAGLVLDPEG